MPLRSNGDCAMSGSRYLLDTKAIIQLLKGNPELALLASKADFLAASVIADLEFLSFRGLSDADAALYRAFRSRIWIFDVPSDDPLFTRTVVEARKTFNLKLPDAIIAATARANALTVLTADDHFKQLPPPWQVRFYTSLPPP